MHHLFKVCLNTDYRTTPGRLTVAIVMAATECQQRDKQRIQRDESSKRAAENNVRKCLLPPYGCADLASDT